jgi:hypothetical protein
VGGAPRVGKSTLCRLLAGKWDLKIYNFDWHNVREHRGRGGPASRWWDERTPNERWIVPSPEELLERSITSWEEDFALVIEDLRALPQDRTVLVDGPGAFPWLVGPNIEDPRQAIFLIPTRERWQAVFDRRWRDLPADSRFGHDTSNQEMATRKLRERDFGLAARIARSCTELGLRSVELDGSLDLDDSIALLEEHFRPHLLAVPNV